MRRRLDRKRSSFLPKGYARRATEKVKLCSRPTVSQKKNKRLFTVKEAINSARNRISSLKDFQFLLYRRSSILQDIYFLYRIRRFVSEFIQYSCKRLLEIRWQWQVVRVYKLHENQGPRFGDHCQTAKHKPHAHQKTHLHTMKVYNTQQPHPQGSSLKKWVGQEKGLASAGHVSPRTP